MREKIEGLFFYDVIVKNKEAEENLQQLINGKAVKDPCKMPSADPDDPLFLSVQGKGPLPEKTRQLPGDKKPVCPGAVKESNLSDCLMEAGRFTVFIRR